ncbi:abnormal spindle-like microcephaly-associated protein homolog [Haliotis asinina]|uniref:abnormal spindle-like microcephaly-associated protein homolog n=1 Tax=Haliotis asinina TaxID=109174 RepID=UPI003532682C
MDNNPVKSAAVDLEWQSLNNVCDDLEQTVTPSRRSRKSWFETPPATKLEIACEKKKRRSSGGGKRKSMENMETLLLTHFTNPPKISFGKIKLGKSRHRHLLVKNVHDYEQSVVIEKFPHKKKFDVDTKSFTVPALESVVLTFSWTPEEDGNVREMILFRVDSAYRLQAFLLGCAESPKPTKKTQKKGLLGAKVKRPFSILHTPGLACIRDNYSPQEAEKEPFIPGKFRVLQENTHHQNQTAQNKGHPVSFPPPRMESTAIAKDTNSSICRSSVYNKMTDIGCSPTLPVSDFSPIPKTESENIHLVDSCCSIMQTSPLREVVINKPNVTKTKDTAKLEARGPDLQFTVLDRKELTDVEIRETMKDSQRAVTPRAHDLRTAEQTESQKEYLSPDSFFNDSLVFRPPLDRKEIKDTEDRSIIRKPRKSWTPQKMSPLRISDGDKSEKRYLSPDSFLNDSLASRISGIGATPGKPYFDTTPDFNHDEFEKSIISPNSFLEELSSTRNDSLEDRRFSRIPSPGSVLNGSVPHDVMVKQLKSVRTSLYEKSLEFESRKTKNVKFTVASKTSRQTSTNHTKKTGVFAPTLSSARRATFISKKADKEILSGAPNAPSPRRATFLVSKKKQGMKKSSPKAQEPLKGQKKMTRSQRFTNIHKAGQLEQKTMPKSHSKVRRRSSGNGESLVKKTRKSRTEVFLTSVEASDAEMENKSDDDVKCEVSIGNENSSATITKDRPFMVTSDMDRSSGRQLFAEDDVKDSSATVTKEKPFMEVTKERRTSGKCLFAADENEFEQNSSATVTKEKPSKLISDMKRGSGKQLFADEGPKYVESNSIESETLTKERPVEVLDVKRGSWQPLLTDEEAKDVRKLSSAGEAEKSHSELSMTGDLLKEQQILSRLEKAEFGSPSKMFNNVFVGESCVGRMSMTVTKERPSLSVVPESLSGESLSVTSTATDTPKSFTQASISGIFSKDRSLNGNTRRFSGKKLFGADPMSPSKSPVLSSIFRDIGSPTRIPSSPDVEVTRRITLTITKSRPSDALIEATKAAVQDTKDTEVDADGQFVVAAKEETFVTVSESKEGYCKRKKILGMPTENEKASYSFKKVDSYEKTVNVTELQTLQEQTRSWEVTSSPQSRPRSNSYTITSPMFSVTPTAIPNSPSSENSRRSTHVISKPKVLDVSANPRRLFPPLDDDEHDSLVVGQLEGKQGESVSSLKSTSSVYSADSLEARKSVSDVSDSNQSKSADLFKNSFEQSKKVVDEPYLDAGKHSSNMSNTSQSMSSLSTSVDVFEKTRDCESKESFAGPVSQKDLSMNDSVFERNENAENIPPTTHVQQKVVETGLKPGIPEKKETMNLLKAGKKSTPDVQPKEGKKRMKVRASKVSPTPVKSDMSPDKSVKNGKENSSKMFIAIETAEKDKCVKTEIKRQDKKPLLSRGLNLVTKKRNMTEDKDAVERQNSKKRSKSDPTENTQPKKPGLLSRLTATTKKSKPPVKGLAQSKLILLKKEKQGMPRHPLPYAAKNMYYDERWMEKQDRGFVHWLNFVLTPPDEYNYVVNKTRVDAGTLNTDLKTLACLAPSKEVLSIRAYTARRRLNRLRRAACQLYQSEKSVNVIMKLEYEVEKKRISVRKDRMVHADIGIKQRILDMLLCYNPLWLRIGLETIFGEVLPLQSNSDVIGLSRYVLCRLLGNPDIAQEYAHPSVPHLYRDGYAEAIAKHALKKFLLLVYFLDHAKTARLIQHDPCLFCKDSDVKASKDMLIQFSRDYLSGEGDVTKHLAYFGYTVSHAQTAMDEFDYAVTKLGVDLRDGVRLSRVLELLTGEWNLVKCLRAPAVSRLQKIHNIEMVFQALTERGLDVAKLDGGKIGARDIVDGHREKTLKILWHLIFHFQVDVLINLEQLREETSLLEQSLRVKVNMQKLLKIKQEDNLARRDSGGLMSQDNERLEMLLKWCRVVCLHYGVKVENFTVSFSDGRALCCLLHHYHPGLLPLSKVHFQTSQSRQQDLEDKEEAACDLDLSQDWSFQYGTGLDNPELYEQLLANERENFKTLYEKVSELGGIPLMLKSVDMSNTIPDEKVVVTYVSYLCGRLLDIRQESRAARVIQIAWRHYKLRTALRAQHHEIKAAQVIQTHVREFLQRKRKEKQMQAAIVVQSVWRGHKARSEARLLRLARDNANMGDAVTKIQAAMQGFAAKQRYQRLRKSTLTLQAHVRGHLARRHVAKQHQAAGIIQSRFRGLMSARKHQEEFLAKRSAAITVQRAFRSVAINRAAHRSAAAGVIQKAWRGYSCRKKLVDLRKSVVLLQGYVRMRNMRREYLKLKETAVMLQERVRANKMSTTARQDFLTKKSAVTMLQSQVRGYQQRMKYAHNRNAAICIQKHFRGHKYRVKFRAMRLAAIILQRAYRLHKMACEEQEALNRFTAACVTIQHWWRRLQQRKMERQHRAATLIQATYRCHMARREFQCKQSAVLTLQTSFRRMTARMQFLRTKAAVIILQHYTRLHLNKRQIQCQMQAKRDAVVRLQTCWRRLQAQRQYGTIRHAVVVIQKNVRMMQARIEYAKKIAARQTSAAVSIQSWWRMLMSRQKFVSLRKNIVVIQAHVRGWHQRIDFLRQRKAAVVIQSYYRAARATREARTRYQVMIGAAMAIQSGWRSYVIKKQFSIMRRSAVKIQSKVRTMLAMKRYHNLKHACVLMQRLYQANRTTKCVRQEFVRTKSAVVTLQTAFRGQRCRKQYQKTKAAAVKIQSFVRMYQDRSKYRQIIQATLVLQRRLRAVRAGQQDRRVYVTNRNNVMKLQAAARGWICRRSFMKTRHAAVTIQKHVRMHQQMKAYRQLKQHVRMDRAAVVLQTRWRMLVERRRFTTMRAACVCVQQQYRAVRSGRQQRQNYLKIKRAVMTIQVAYRAAVCKRNAKREQSAVLIQSFVRKHLIRSRFLCMKKSAIKLQACVRMIKERNVYRKQKHAVCHIQQWYRSIKHGQRSRRRFLIMKGAAITIQAVWRGHIVRRQLALYHKNASVIQSAIRAHQQQKRYRKLRATVISLQKLYRNSKETTLERQRFIQKKSASIVVQKTIRMFMARRKYLEQKSAALKIQRAFHCYKERSAFILQREAAKVIQEKWRATLSARDQRRQYLIVVGAAITIQQGYRSYQTRQNFLHTCHQIIQVQAYVRAFIHRKRYQHLQKAAFIIQTTYRRRCQAQNQRKEFLKMRLSACMLQSAYRRWKHRQIRRRHVAATTIQSVFRMLVVKKQFCLTRQRVVLVQAVVRGFLARCSYSNKLRAISVIQRNMRTFLLFNGLREMVAQRRHAVSVIQRAYKRYRHALQLKKHKAATVIQSTFRMHSKRKTFRQTSQAALLIQSSWRGYMVRQTFRQTLQKHRAAACLQRSFRGFKARVHLQKLQAERKAQLEMYARRAKVHLAAVRIQTWYRQCLMLRQARQRIASIICIQRHVRAFLVRVHYIKLRNSTVLLQQQCRQWLALRQRSAVVIQSAVRHWLVRERQLRLHRQVARIQAVWRGYWARKNITCKKIRRARARCHEASQNATEDKKLGNRTTSALDYLLEYKSVSHILEALIHLDVATRLSPRCCQRLVEVHAVHVIYRLIRSCNRSLPHMEMIKYSVNILLNLAKYDKTVNAVHDVESTDILVDLMQIYREKGNAIFAKTCSLLGILALDPHRRQEILQQTKLMEKIRSIQSLVARKNKVDERHKLVKARMAASRSFNSTLPLPTPVKRRRIRPEWTLKRDSLHALSEPLPAINFVLENLHLSAK